MIEKYNNTNKTKGDRSITGVHGRFYSKSPKNCCDITCLGDDDDIWKWSDMGRAKRSGTFTEVLGGPALPPGRHNRGMNVMRSSLWKIATSYGIVCAVELAIAPAAATPAEPSLNQED